MQLSRQAFILFALNFFDAVLTLYWVHNGFASEGNQLMAGLIDAGYIPFLAVKLSIGAIAAVDTLALGQSSAGEIRIKSRAGDLRQFDGRSSYHRTFSIRLYLGESNKRCRRLVAHFFRTFNINFRKS